MGIGLVPEKFGHFLSCCRLQGHDSTGIKCQDHRLAGEVVVIVEVCEKVVMKGTETRDLTVVIVTYNRYQYLARL